MEQWGGDRSEQADQGLHRPFLLRGFQHACPLIKKGIGSQPTQTEHFSEIIHAKQLLDM